MFITFPDKASAYTALTESYANPLTFGGRQAFLHHGFGPSPDLFLYNMPVDFTHDEMVSALSKFGTLTFARSCELSTLHKLEHRLTRNLYKAFQLHGPNVSGRAHVSFETVEQGKKLMEATMNEEVIIGGNPLRAEYSTFKAKDEQPQSSSRT